MNTRPAVIAHRGASRASRENTLDAFRRARLLGADWVELDVRLSLDGALVVHHDPRYADGRAVCDVDKSTRPPHVPLLADALDACEGMGVNVEIKNTPGEPGYDADARVADVVVDVLRSRTTPPILISSFDRACLARINGYDTALLTFALDDRDAVIAECVRAAHRALHPFDATVDAALVRAAHDAAIAVNVWTVDDAARIAQLASWSVDGICTNVPDVAVAALGR